jgi:hypothetical protein
VDSGVRITRAGELRLSDKGTVRPRLSNRNAFGVDVSVLLRSLNRVDGHKITLATDKLSIPASSGQLTTLKLSSANRALVRRLKHLRVLVRIVVSNATGEKRDFDAAFDLLPPRAARR